MAFLGSVAVLPNVSEGTPDALVKQRLLHKDITKFWGGNQGLVCLFRIKRILGRMHSALMIVL